MKSFGYVGKDYDKFGTVVEAKSSDAMNHTVTVKDDYGNVKQVIHYQNQSKEEVQNKLKETGYHHPLDTF